jgi:hypothetical protein
MDKELVLQVHKYGLSIVRKDDGYCLVEQKTSECYESMSIKDIKILIDRWNGKTM